MFSAKCWKFEIIWEWYDNFYSLLFEHYSSLCYIKTGQKNSSLVFLYLFCPERCVMYCIFK
jgi:hypothetical protein